MPEVLSLDNPEKWMAFLHDLPSSIQDIFYEPQYYNLYEKMGYGKAISFVLTVNNHIALFPFLLNSINSLGYDLDREYFDIQGAYGYNGILANTDDKDFQAVFFREFENYCNENDIVASFTRFNPVLANESFSSGFDVVPSQENIIVDLRLHDLEHDSYEYSTRKNIKKAIRSGLSVIKIIDDKRTWIPFFTDIYFRTMDRNRAEKYYYFTEQYIEDLVNSPFCHLYFTMQQDVPISTEIVLGTNLNAYSFLGGTLEEYYPLRPNDILKDFIIRDLKKSGFAFFCLGGGGEGVTRYKKTFARNGSRPFSFGKKIYNEHIYSDIHAQWKNRFPAAYLKNEKKVLGYREI
jgi:hypothetical protein